MSTTATAAKYEEILQATNHLYSKKPDWVSFYRDVLGLNGVVRRTLPDQKSLAEFEQSEVFEEIQHLLTTLRGRKATPPNPGEETRVITVRLPQSLHETLRVEAYECHTSMNKLCISKLLQYINNEKVPAEA